LGDDNVATFPLAPGIKQFAIFCQEAGIDASSDDTIAMPAGIISDLDDDEEEEEEISNDRKRRGNPWTLTKTKPGTEQDKAFEIKGA
jgi:hypothetical protein